jgi:RNA polymerase sigma-70 factor (ECF subfamily)
LFRIAANALADQFKRAAREVAASAEEPPEPSVQPDLEAIEHRARLFRLVEDLPEDQRRVVLQRFVEQKSIREIAKKLARSEGAVKQLQFRALQSLRAEMEGGHG